MTQFEQTFNLMKKPIVITVYAILVILTYIYADKNTATYFYQLNLRSTIHALSVLTAFGFWAAYILLFTMSALYFHFIKKNALYEAYSWYLLACVLIVNLVCLILKICLSRARPELLFTNSEFGFYWFKLHKVYWSFPSGHTTTVVSLAAGLGILFPRYFYALLSFALLVAVSRVLLYYHYLSDVMTAFYITILVIGCFTQYTKKSKIFGL